MGSAAGGAAPGSAFSPPPSGLWDLPKSDRFWHKLECILFCINAWGRWSTLWSLGLGAAKLYSSVSRNTFPRLETAMTLSQLVRTLLCYLSVMLEITSASPVIAPFFFSHFKNMSCLRMDDNSMRRRGRFSGIRAPSLQITFIKFPKDSQHVMDYCRSYVIFK